MNKREYHRVYALGYMAAKRKAKQEAEAEQKSRIIIATLVLGAWTGIIVWGFFIATK